MALKHTSSHFSLLLLFALGLFVWTGCDDDDGIIPTPECTFGEINQLNYTDYCDPSLLTFRIGAPDIPQPFGLPDFCFSDYTNSVSMELEVPAGGMIYLHRYRDFPADITMEFIGTNCEANDYVLLNDCANATSRRLVETYTINATSFTTLIVRAVYTQNSDYMPGTREDDVLEFGAFTSPYTPAQIVNANGAQPLALDCNGELPSFILSPSPGGVSPIDAAMSLGFPYESCDCDEEIVLVELPPGVSLNKVRPKVPRDRTETDTTNFDRNRLISTPITQFTNSDFGNPQLDPNVGGNPCLDFQEPLVDGGNNALRVVIIDSGVDGGGNPFFSDMEDISPNNNCITHGPLGYDFVSGDDTPDDLIGHGTLVASTYLSGLGGVNNVSLVNYKFLDTDYGTLFNAMCATSSAVVNDADIINMSWGFPAPSMPSVLRFILENAEANEVVVVTSAGNDQRNVKTNPMYWPAAASVDFSNVVTVGSHSIDGTDGPFLVDFSNFSDDAVTIAAAYSVQARGLGGVLGYPAGTSISAPIVARELTVSATIGTGAEAIINALFSNGNKVGMNDTFLGLVNGERYLRTPTWNPANNECGLLPL